MTPGVAPVRSQIVGECCMNRVAGAVAPLLAVVSILLVGCANGVVSAEPSTEASVHEDPSGTPTPSALSVPAVEPNLVVDSDGISYIDAAGAETVPFDDRDAVLALLEQATGELPAPEPIEPPTGYDMQLERYSWDGLWVTADVDHEMPVRIAVVGAQVDGIPIATEDGLAVGSTRDEVLAADGWALVFEEDQATATQLGVGGREVPGTKSLSNPGSVGIVYVLFTLEGDEVKQFYAPSDDFSDL
ncbi:hypothetical protein [Microbacterium sp.]|uniref:hypothetical protein n=1 Tax=Microbacterium sp. TaxID=51671 RepID=UPI002D0B0EE6|nr:hypothetical protein [Microbacterium sp.]HWK76471.1 hypothetical protein [Microbacterium sp.]